MDFIENNNKVFTIYRKINFIDSLKFPSKFPQMNSS